MLLIPAIDLKDGQCVRLKQGLMEDATVFNNSPAAQAQAWLDQGARRLHLVDLNGAFAGKPAPPFTAHDSGPLQPLWELACRDAASQRTCHLGASDPSPSPASRLLQGQVSPRWFWYAVSPELPPVFPWH